MNYETGLSFVLCSGFLVLSSLFFVPSSLLLVTGWSAWREVFPGPDDVIAKGLVAFLRAFVPDEILLGEGFYQYGGVAGAVAKPELGSGDLKPDSGS